ncbi:hypothetical protein SAMN05661080_03898 [Modestobacter sp. DSM 44400]|uniref:hypothetical protein n=1 Tax=Modestobacter sp. DSM 44400 TaxID=1550230 RepID=UPI000894B0BF|nr:hypothetical protein [Modestobacter sp. DSM 44400]SDY56952.1 hypothetical protein SAMN05661080_03898 [Modestobacter sp. DSM 44400]
MTALLVTLTIVEIVLVLAVLVYYLARIAGSLRRTSTLLGKVAFGVRAIETQCSIIGPSVLTVNEQLGGIAGALAELTDLADAVVGPTPTAGATSTARQR